MPGMGIGDTSAPVDQVPTITSVLPNEMLTSLDLPGQFDSIPGGFSNNGAYPGGAADPSGINSLFLDSSINPQPTGDYMKVLSAVATAAASGFSTYAKGSPSVAVPYARLPGSSFTPTMLAGKTNWLVIGLVVAAGIGVLAILAVRA